MVHRDETYQYKLCHIKSRKLDWTIISVTRKEDKVLKSIVFSYANSVIIYIVEKLQNCTLINTIYALPTFGACFEKMSEYSEKCAEKKGLKPA